MQESKQITESHMTNITRIPTYIQNSQAMSRAIKCFCKVYKILKLLTQQCHSNRVTRAETSSQITKILPVAAAKGEFSHVLRVKIFYGNGKRYINKDQRSLKRFRQNAVKIYPCCVWLCRKQRGHVELSSDRE